MFPLLTQILEAVWNKAKLFTVRKEPVKLVALGTVQIMVGLCNIGLNLVAGQNGVWSFGGTYFLSALYIVCGLVSFLFHPSICWVIFTAFVNLVTVPGTIVGVVTYVIDDRLEELVARLHFFSAALTVLQLCVCVNLAVICIREMVRREKEELGEDFQESKEVVTSCDVLVA